VCQCESLCHLTRSVADYTAAPDVPTVTALSLAGVRKRRNTNVPFKGRIQKRKTNHLQIITFGLQRAETYAVQQKRLLDHLVGARDQCR
jgi:hypothetical protein